MAGRWITWSRVTCLLRAVRRWRHHAALNRTIHRPTPVHNSTSDIPSCAQVYSYNWRPAPPVPARPISGTGLWSFSYRAVLRSASNKDLSVHAPFLIRNYHSVGCISRQSHHRQQTSPPPGAAYWWTLRSNWYRHPADFFEIYRPAWLWPISPRKK